jgi:hypothetical protein
MHPSDTRTRKPDPEVFGHRESDLIKAWIEQHLIDCIPSSRNATARSGTSTVYF